MKLVFCLFILLSLSYPAFADITIAAVGPITGQDASTGEQMQRGAEAAVASLNATGGILGQKVHLLIKDDACDPKQAVAIANEVSTENVTAVIGHMCSGSAIPASKNYNEESILMISPSATSPLLTDQGLNNVFRTCGRDDQQGAVAAAYIREHFPHKRLAIIHDKTAYGQGLADEVRKTLRKVDYPETLYDSISRGERDYATLVSKLKEHKIDVLYYGGYHTEAGLIVRQMRDLGVHAAFISDDDLTTKEFWSITGDAGEGVLMTFNPDPRVKPEAQEAVRRIREKGFDPEGTTLYTYAAVEIIATAIREAGTTKLDDLVRVMHQKTFATVLGPVAFDKKGDVTKPDYILYLWSHGAYHPLTGP